MDLTVGNDSNVFQQHMPHSRLSLLVEMWTEESHKEKKWQMQNNVPRYQLTKNTFSLCVKCVFMLSASHAERWNRAGWKNLSSVNMTLKKNPDKWILIINLEFHYGGACISSGKRGQKSDVMSSHWCPTCDRRGRQCSPSLQTRWGWPARWPTNEPAEDKIKWLHEFNKVLNTLKPPQCEFGLVLNVLITPVITLKSWNHRIFFLLLQINILLITNQLIDKSLEP